MFSGPQIRWGARDLGLQIAVWLKTEVVTRMNEQLKGNLKNQSTWRRILYMLLFAIAYSVAEMVVSAIVVAQVVFVLFSGKPNEQLLDFGAQLSRYLYEVLRYLTFNTDRQPFPFSAWNRFDD